MYYFWFFIDFCRKLIQNHYMIKSMIIRDLRSRYSGSLMGLFWAIIHPLMMVVTYTFIFSIVFRAKLGPEAGTTNFTLWLLGGMLPWFLFAESVQRCSGIIIENKNLITKTLFPSEILPLTVLFANIVNHLIIFAIVIIMTILIVGKITAFILLLPFYYKCISQRYRATADSNNQYLVFLYPYLLSSESYA